MHKLLVTTMAAAATFAVCALASPRAEAMPLAAPGGLAAAIQSQNLAQDVNFFCRRVWRCGYWGCGWRRVCSFGPSYGYGYGYGPSYGYYGGGYGYGYRPFFHRHHFFFRRHHFHRHWW